MERVSALPICQGKTVKFKCENSSLVIVIYAATYGRSYDGDTICRFDDEVNPSVRKMNDTADDNSIPCPERNVTLDIMRLCDFKRRCVVTANETYFGNPCKGVYKYLIILYACGEYRTFFIKLEFLRLFVLMISITDKNKCWDYKMKQNEFP